MPKRKKTKVSLVSAYESGAESSTGDESGSENENSDQSEQSDSNNNANNSNASIDETSQANSVKEINVASGIESGGGDNKDESRKPLLSVDLNEVSRVSEDRDGAVDVLSAGEDKAELSEPGSVQIDSIYTLDRGFPPGCDRIKLPPAPKATCSQTLQNKIIQVAERMKPPFNYSINDDIQKKKLYKNPSIYEKLIEVNKIDEFGSNFQNGFLLYNELDEIQKAEWAKREKEKKERTKIEMVSGTKKKL